VGELLVAYSLLLVGFLLLAVEGFVLPGFGLVGIGGLVIVAGGCFLAWMTQGWDAGLAAIAVSAVTLLVGLWLLSRSRAAKRMVLSHHNPGESADTDGLRRLVGRTGVTTSDLRPSGTAEIDGARHQVQSGGEWLAAGTPVRVTRVGTFSLFVEKIDASDDAVRVSSATKHSATPAEGEADR